MCGVWGLSNRVPICGVCHLVCGVRAFACCVDCVYFVSLCMVCSMVCSSVPSVSYMRFVTNCVLCHRVFGLLSGVGPVSLWRTLSLYGEIVPLCLGRVGLSDLSFVWFRLWAL